MIKINFNIKDLISLSKITIENNLFFSDLQNGTLTHFFKNNTIRAKKNFKFNGKEISLDNDLYISGKHNKLFSNGILNQTEKDILIKYYELYNSYKSDGKYFFSVTENGNTQHYNIKSNDYKNFIIETIKVCPYCGKTPFYKRIGKNKKYLYSFDLDHFLPRSHYPQYSTFLFNLIPVCKACNSSFSKSNTIYSKGKYFHPYFGWLEFKNSIWTLSNSDLNKDFDDVFDLSKTNYLNIKSFKNQQDIDKDEHLKYFNLGDIYKYSSDSIYDYKFFLEKRDIINYRLSGSRKNKFRYLIKRKNLVREYFSSWYPENKGEILKIPNGKMRKDLIERFSGKI